ncbi:hypothetical protein K474DRAFT_1668999 [Panus rudis PR-1116 ss-1]|nr:hypothetical protein K474DRAFT_1668999 [Panus rudis PR-1116 ss-1]
MSSRTKLPSVTPPHTVAVCNAMKSKVRAHTDTSFFANIREDRKTIAVVCADQTTATLTKVNASTTGPFRGIGYKLTVNKPSMKEILNIWIEGPSDDLEVNRRYLIEVLQDIIENPHAGKTTFTGGARQ